MINQHRVFHADDNTVTKTESSCSPDSQEMARPPQDHPPLHPSSSSSSLTDDELLLTPLRPYQDLVDERPSNASYAKSTDQNQVCVGFLGTPRSPADLLRKGLIVGYVDELESPLPRVMTEGTWAGGLEMWKTPLEDGRVEFDVRGWCTAKEQYDEAVLAGKKTFNPRPTQRWRRLRIINYLFCLSTFLGLAGYALRFALLFADGVCEHFLVNVAFYLVVATCIFAVGFP